jgi:hypothetical protein
MKRLAMKVHSECTASCSRVPCSQPRCTRCDAPPSRAARQLLIAQDDVSGKSRVTAAQRKVQREKRALSVRWRARLQWAHLRSVAVCVCVCVCARARALELHGSRLHGIQT